MEQEGIAQVFAGDRAKGTPEPCQGRSLGQQLQGLAAESSREASIGPQAEQRQGPRGPAAWLQPGHEPLPFLHGCGAA